MVETAKQETGAEKPDGATRGFVALAAIIPTLVSAFVAMRTYQLDATLKADKAREELDLRVYEAVRESLGGNAKDQKVALALVVALAHDPLKSELINVFSESDTTDPEVTAQASLYRQEAPSHSSDVSTKTSNKWGDWDFDLFYCATSPEIVERQASDVQAALIADGAGGRVRVRTLEAEVNDRPGYRVKGYTIHRGADEAPIADALKALADRTVGLPADGGFTLVPSGEDTRWYISVFFCPLAPAQAGG